MAIIVSKDHQNAERVDPSDFSLESDMQKYIIDNPSIIPLYDIDEDIRLFVAAREFQTKSGPIDALGFDQNGNIYVVETKLYRNPDKRTVVAQSLDYGASLWRHATSFDDFVNALDSHCNKQFQASFQQKLEEFFELSETENIISSIQSNLNSGNIKFVVMMDSLDNRLKDLIVYVNQNSHFDIYAVELEYYKHNEFEIMIPKIFGDEVKKEVVSTSKSFAQPWVKATEEDFIRNVEERFSNGDYSDGVRNGLLSLNEIYKKLGEKVGRSSTYSYRPEYNDVRCFGADTTSFILDSVGRLESWKHSKNTDAIEKLVNNVEQASNEKGLFAKDWTTKKSWGCTLRNFPDSDVDEFVAIVTREFEALYD